MGWGGVGMFTFPRPRSLDVAQDVDAMLTWGGVGCGGDANVHPTLHKTLMRGDDNAHSTLRKTLMLRPR